MEIRYVHVQWTASGAHDMVPSTSAPLLEKAGDLKIIDPTPAAYKRFKGKVPLGTSATAKPKTTARKRVRKATVLVTEPAPTGAPTAEEATK